ncbi:uncharacterized protein LOC123534905 [Mercenaria mercenaria]|uniref:uncharacterized protein LOC123534905 n=1 Tax=Mercenaria mercenaria TaxID=6596 RepID=UPI00234F160C|nr:uncharacterized protein LOC123534905 [Mercenaria mercenaria]
MKGSSSARLPALNKTSSLVARQFVVANPCPKKKNKEKGRKSRDKKETKMKTFPHDCDTIIRSKHENDIICKGINPTSKLKLTVNMPDVADNFLEQRKMSEMEAFFRRKRENYMENHPPRESSVTSLQKRRLLSAKSRDHLLSLMPTKEVSKNCINEDLVISAKQGLDMIRRHNSKKETRSSELNKFYKESKKASKLRDLVFGVRDRTNNSVETTDHMSDRDSRRPYFLAPISMTQNELNAVQKQMKAYFAEKFKETERNDKGAKFVSSTIDTEKPVKDKNGNSNDFDFYL